MADNNNTPTGPVSPVQYSGWASFYGGNVQASTPDPFTAASLGQPDTTYSGGWAYPDAWARFYGGTYGFDKANAAKYGSASGALAAENYANNIKDYTKDPNFLGWEQAFGSPATILKNDSDWSKSLGKAPLTGGFEGGWINPDAWAAYYGGKQGFTAPENAGTPAAALAAAAMIAKTSNPETNPALVGWVKDYGQPGTVLTNTTNWATSLGNPAVDTYGHGIDYSDHLGWESPLAWAAYYGGFQGYNQAIDNTLQDAKNWAGVTDSNDPSLLGWELDYGSPSTVVSQLEALTPVVTSTAATPPPWTNPQATGFNAIDFNFNTTTNYDYEVAQGVTWNPSNPFYTYKDGNAYYTPQGFLAYVTKNGAFNPATDYTGFFDQASLDDTGNSAANLALSASAAQTAADKAAAAVKAATPPPAPTKKTAAGSGFKIDPTTGKVTISGVAAGGTTSDFITTTAPTAAKSGVQIAGTTKTSTTPARSTYQTASGLSAYDQTIGNNTYTYLSDGSINVNGQQVQPPSSRRPVPSAWQLANQPESGMIVESFGTHNIAGAGGPSLIFAQSQGQADTFNALYGNYNTTFAAAGTAGQTAGIGVTPFGTTGYPGAYFGDGSYGGGLSADTSITSGLTDPETGEPTLQGPIDPGTGEHFPLMPYGLYGTYIYNPLPSQAPDLMQRSLDRLIAQYAPDQPFATIQNTPPDVYSYGTAYDAGYGYGNVDNSGFTNVDDYGRPISYVSPSPYSSYTSFPDYGGLFTQDLPPLVLPSSWTTPYYTPAEQPVTNTSAEFGGPPPTYQGSPTAGAPGASQAYYSGTVLDSIISSLGNLFTPYQPSPVAAEPTFANIPLTSGYGTYLPGAEVPYLDPFANRGDVGTDIAITPYAAQQGGTRGAVPAQEFSGAAQDFQGVAPPLTFPGIVPFGQSFGDVPGITVPMPYSPPQDVWAAAYGVPENLGGYDVTQQEPEETFPARPFSRSEEFVKKVGAKTTIAQIAAKTGHPLDSQGEYWLGTAKDMPIDLTQPFAEQMKSNILNAPDAGNMRETVAEKSVAKYNETMAAQAKDTGMSVAQIERAVIDAAKQVYADIAQDKQQDIEESANSYYSPIARGPVYTQKPPQAAYWPEALPAGVARPPADLTGVGQQFQGSPFAGAPGEAAGEQSYTGYYEAPSAPAQAPAPTQAPAPVQQQTPTPNTDYSYLEAHGAHSTNMYGEEGHVGDEGKVTPELANRLEAVGRAYKAATGNDPVFGETDRGADIQDLYYDAYQRTLKGQPLTEEEQFVGAGGGIAARGGESAHQHGNAMDIPEGPFRDWATKNAKQFGLEFIVEGDPEHVQPIRGWKGTLPLVTPPTQASELGWNVSGYPQGVQQQAGYSYPSGAFSGGEGIQAGYQYPSGTFASGVSGIPAGYSYIPGAFGEIDPYNFSSAPYPAGGYGGGAAADPLAQGLGLGDIKMPLQFDAEGEQLSPAPLGDILYRNIDWSKFNPTPSTNIEDVRPRESTFSNDVTFTPVLDRYRDWGDWQQFPVEKDWGPIGGEPTFASMYNPLSEQLGLYGDWSNPPLDAQVTGLPGKQSENLFGEVGGVATNADWSRLDPNSPAESTFAQQPMPGWMDRVTSALGNLTTPWDSGFQAPPDMFSVEPTFSGQWSDEDEARKQATDQTAINTVLTRGLNWSLPQAEQWIADLFKSTPTGMEGAGAFGGPPLGSWDQGIQSDLGHQAENPQLGEMESGLRPAGEQGRVNAGSRLDPLQQTDPYAAAYGTQPLTMEQQLGLGDVSYGPGTGYGTYGVDQIQQQYGPGTGYGSYAADYLNPENVPFLDPFADSSSAVGKARAAGVPTDILDKAAALVRGGKNTAELQKWMADQGYPQYGNWCAEFVSDVVVAAGGTPPGGEVRAPQKGYPRGEPLSTDASSWLQWGEATKNAKPGDVLVTSSPKTGEGGHIVVVESIDPDTGKAVVIQGNGAKEYGVNIKDGIATIGGRQYEARTPGEPYMQTMTPFAGGPELGNFDQFTAIVPESSRGTYTPLSYGGDYGPQAPADTGPQKLFGQPIRGGVTSEVSNMPSIDPWATAYGNQPAALPANVSSGAYTLDPNIPEPEAPKLKSPYELAPRALAWGGREPEAVLIHHTEPPPYKGFREGGPMTPEQEAAGNAQTVAQIQGIAYPGGVGTGPQYVADRTTGDIFALGTGAYNTTGEQSFNTGTDPWGQPFEPLLGEGRNWLTNTNIVGIENISSARDISSQDEINANIRMMETYYPDIPAFAHADISTEGTHGKQATEGVDIVDAINAFRNYMVPQGFAQGGRSGGYLPEQYSGADAIPRPPAEIPSIGVSPTGVITYPSGQNALAGVGYTGSVDGKGLATSNPYQKNTPYTANASLFVDKTTIAGKDPNNTYGISVPVAYRTVGKDLGYFMITNADGTAGAIVENIDQGPNMVNTKSMNKGIDMTKPLVDYLWGGKDLTATGAGVVHYQWIGPALSDAAQAAQQYNVPILGPKGR